MLMAQRIDRLMSERGLLQAPRTYSLLLEQDSLYLIEMGPVPRGVMEQSGVLERLLMPFVKHKIEGLLLANENRLDQQGIEAFAAHQVRAFEVSDIKRLEFTERARKLSDKLSFVYHGEQISLLIPKSQQASLRSFIKELEALERN